MDAKKYYEMADLALCEKNAYSQSVAAAAAQISIAISLHRIAESARTDTRDFFAAVALQGLLAGPQEGPECTEASIAAAAFRYADVMMQFRESETVKEVGGTS
jgi:hypothetical protein